MKFVIVISLFLPVFLNGQIFFDQSKVFYSETDALLIPSIHFGYGLKQYDFIDMNTGLAVDRKHITPSLYIGCQLLSDGFMVGAHIDPFNFGFMLGGGFNIPIHTGKRKKK